MRTLPILGAALLALATSACARHVDVAYTPLAASQSIRSTVALQVKDARRQTGQNISKLPQDILVARSVSQIVGDAVAAELVSHGIGGGQGPVVEVKVWTFDFDYRVGMWNNEFSGEVAFKAAAMAIIQSS